MPREVKQAGGTSPDGAMPSVVPSPRPVHVADPAHPGGRPTAVVARWFEALDPTAQPVAAPRVPRWGGRSVARAAGAPIALIALAVIAEALVLHAADPVGLLALLPLALVAGASALALRALRRSRDGAALVGGGSGLRHGAARGVEVDGERLSFRGASPPPPNAPNAQAASAAQVILHLDAPFGVTLLASPRRERMIALLSSASGTFYLGAAFDAASRRAFAPLLDRAFTVVGDDVGLEAIAPDGEPLLFSPEELASLLDALLEQSPTCLERFVLTDARGAALTLDGRHLCAGERSVDLHAPLEWKPIVFQEAFGHAVAVYQGTWIRQGGTELTLVSLLPALGAPPGSELDAATLDRGVLRDLRLMQALPEQPPPSEQRVAIERLFMLPVRSALDRAPRASHQPDRALA